MVWAFWKGFLEERNLVLVKRRKDIPGTGNSMTRAWKLIQDVFRKDKLFSCLVES